MEVDQFVFKSLHLRHIFGALCLCYNLITSNRIDLYVFKYSYINSHFKADR